MASKLTILYVSIDAVGHFNACQGIAEQLRDRGHKVIFAVPNGWKGKMSSLGFEEEWYSTVSPSTENVNGGDLGNVSAGWQQLTAQLEPMLDLSPFEQVEGILIPMYEKVMNDNKVAEPQLREIVARVKPDVIVADMSLQQPAIMDSGIPWVLSVSLAPLALSTENVPPAFTGWAIDSDRGDWEKLLKLRDKVVHDTFVDFNSWVMENGGPDLKRPRFFWLEFSKYANIYMYPEELDYDMYRPYPPKFYRFDAFVRASPEVFEIPEKLKNLPGKLIYFSMGTLGCCLLRIMKKLIGILGKSPHRFIVSKGPLGDELELPENMWGANNLPQTSIIPIADLVISHGGNNTLTETFYFGKRILILPLFSDQRDNGQRVTETGLGLYLNPNSLTEEELLGAVEKLLSNELLAKRMATISKRIQSSNNQSRAADVIENVARENPTK